MSIDIRCYSVMDLGDLRAKLDCLMQKYSYIFNDVYHIFEPEGVLSHQVLMRSMNVLRNLIQNLHC